MWSQLCTFTKSGLFLEVFGRSWGVLSLIILYMVWYRGSYGFDDFSISELFGLGIGDVLVYKLNNWRVGDGNTEGEDSTADFARCACVAGSVFARIKR